MDFVRKLLLLFEQQLHFRVYILREILSFKSTFSQNCFATALHLNTLTVEAFREIREYQNVSSVFQIDFRVSGYHCPALINGYFRDFRTNILDCHYRLSFFVVNYYIILTL